MRIMLFYDLSMTSPEDIKEYNTFHKWIIRRGYVMLQESIYYKTITTQQKYANEIIAIKKVLPTKGNVRTLLISESRFFSMKVLNGQMSLNEKYNGQERYIKIENENKL